MRITSQVLQNKLDLLNAKLTDQTLRMELDLAPHRGGWVLVNYYRAKHATSHMSAKEMAAYLDGALYWAS